ncbi:hypothetical protein KR018_010059, partial [Drosophila ironensis]
PKEVDLKAAAAPEPGKDYQEKMAAEKEHLEKMAAIANLPKILGAKIECIKKAQKQLLKLQIQQMVMLDGCIDVLQELNSVEPKNLEEKELIIQTFLKTKEMISEVFQEFLPAQIELLKHQTSIIGLSMNAASN